MRSAFGRLMSGLALVALWGPGEVHAQIKDQDEVAVLQILKALRQADEKRDNSGIRELFSPDARVYSNGRVLVGESIEGPRRTDAGAVRTIGDYLQSSQSHLQDDFKALAYTDYRAHVTVAGSRAFTSEVYKYTLVLAKDGSIVNQQGLQTTVLQKTDSGWKIVMKHANYGRARRP